MPRYAWMNRTIRFSSNSSSRSKRVHAVSAMRGFIPGYGARIKLCPAITRIPHILIAGDVVTLEDSGR